jgi:competence protein ComEC
MIKWAPYVFVRFTLYLILGILLAIVLPLPPPLWRVVAFGLLLLVYVVLLTLRKTWWKGLRLHLWFGLPALGITVLFGMLLTYQQTQSHHPDHLLHQTSDFQYYQGTISNEVQERAKSDKAELTLSQLRKDGKWIPVSGTVLLYLGKRSERPQYGDVLLIKGMPQRVPAPANPGEFDYRQYLSLKQIHHQHFVKPAQFLIIDHQPGNPVLAASIRVRQWADGVFRRLIPSPREYAITTGLVLGIRSVLDNEIKSAYSSAGAMHVLAVSGGHVIIVFQIITLALGRVKKRRYGNWLFATIALTLLWFYAFVTGLSASVMRAVIMYTFVIIAKAISRDTNLYNTLGASAFILLCWDPYLIMDVGFQLSYAAVLGIVYLVPLLERWFTFSNRWAKEAWQISCVSLASQIAIFPLGLFYFHQFPVYFLVANLFIIPLSTFILQGGLLLLLVSWIPYVSVGVAFLLKWLVWLLNGVAFVTETLPGAVISGISISRTEFIVLYGLLVCALVFFHYKKLWQWGGVFVLLTAFVSMGLWKSYHQFDQYRLAVYAINGHSTLDIVEGQHHILLTDSALAANNERINYHITNDWRQRGIRKSEVAVFGKAAIPDLAFRHTEPYSVLIWQGKSWIYLHQPVNPAFLNTLQTDFLIIGQNAIRKLPDLQGKVGMLILDSSNKPWLARKLKKQATDLHLPCHWVGDDGAFVWEAGKQANQTQGINY